MGLMVPSDYCDHCPVSPHKESLYFFCASCSTIYGVFHSPSFLPPAVVWHLFLEQSPHLRAREDNFHPLKSVSVFVLNMLWMYLANRCFGLFYALKIIKTTHSLYLWKSSFIKGRVWRIFQLLFVNTHSNLAPPIRLNCALPLLLPAVGCYTKWFKAQSSHYIKPCIS